MHQRFQRIICCLFLLFSLLSGPSNIAAQNADLGIGQWRVHLPYNLGKSVAETGKKVYCASVSGLFSYTKEDGALKRISKIDGLSDFQIHRIRYNYSVGVLVIAYENSNIDLIYDDGRIVNLSDIKRKNLTGNTAINDIYIKDRLAYLACGFGIVILDLDKQEVKDTYYIGPNGTSMNVNGVTSDGTSFYAAGDNGIYKALTNDPLLYLYTAWNKDTTLTYRNSRYSSICSLNSRVYAVLGDTVVLRHDNTGWTKFDTVLASNKYVMTNGNYLVIKNQYDINAYDANETRQHYSLVGSSPQEAVVDAGNVMYMADGISGLIKTDQSSYSYIFPNGPGNIGAVTMASGGDHVWVASGAITDLTSHAPLFSKEGVYHYTNNNWNTFNKLTTTVFDTIGFPDVLDVKLDPTDPTHAFVAGWGGGVLEFKADAFVKRYDETNSTLKGLNVPNYHPILVGGLNFDQNNNLWVLNTGTTSPINVRLSDGTWKSFWPPKINLANYFSNILADDNGYKWFIINTVGIGVFYENDMDNPSDDRFKILTTGTGFGNLPSSQIFSMVKDMDNTIWIGSENGVAAFYSPQSVFDPTGFDAQQVLIQQGAHTQILLQSQSVTAIAVDGGNRKWFGTSNGGVFLTSPDGATQLLSFNTDNSPLLSNNIKCITIDPVTGEVFFGTDKGICSYRAAATEGQQECDKYYVFPNPVKHEYTGVIAVKGLVANARVKFADIAGNVVFETTAIGGQATWNGTNYLGERAHSGVYLVYITNDDGSATCVTKFLMVN